MKIEEKRMANTEKLSPISPILASCNSFQLVPSFIKEPLLESIFAKRKALQNGEKTESFTPDELFLIGLERGSNPPDNDNPWKK